MDKNIGKQSLEEIDRYIKNNLLTLTCSQIYDFYFHFFYCLKEYKGNSYGFTGLSEYLIFRSLYHLLCGSFVREKVHGSDWIYEFKSKNQEDIRIRQSIPLLMSNKKKIIPDITIIKAGKIIAVIQIKIYLSGGIKEINDEIEKFKKIMAKFDNISIPLIIFELSKKGKIFTELKNIEDNEPWFNFVILKQNEKFIARLLIDHLRLNECIISNNK